MLEVAVCDDRREELDTISAMLQEICRQINKECHISVYQDPAELFSHCHKLDICILDVVMSGDNGIDVGIRLKEKYPEISLIYTTSCGEYCNQAINKAHAFSFLIKPVGLHELKEQVQGCIRDVPRKGRGTELIFENVRNENGGYLGSVRLYSGDILYCEYVKSKREIAVVLEEDTYYFKGVFEALVKRVEDYDFAINCRGSIVNLRHIVRIKGYSIYLDNGQELLLTQKRAAAFKKEMNAYIH